jgi:hypothetical protein
MRNNAYNPKNTIPHSAQSGWTLGYIGIPWPKLPAACDVGGRFNRELPSCPATVEKGAGALTLG